MKRRTLLAAIVASWVPVQPGPAARKKTTTKVGGNVKTLKLVGDSITWGGLVAANDRPVVRLQQAIYGTADPSAQGWQIVQNGIGGTALVSGTNPPPLVQTFPGLIADMVAGDVVVINIGMNDLFDPNYTDAAWTAAYVSIVAQAQAKGINVLIGQITPVGSNHAAQEPLRERLNKWLCDHFGDIVMLYSNLLQSWGAGNPYIDPQYAYGDGVHVSAWAYVRMADYIVATLKAANIGPVAK